jgi:DNA-3-methyladenine glycosylase II
MFTILPKGSFSLAQAAGFAFGPREQDAGDVMRLCFAADGSGAPAGVVLRQTADGSVAGELQGESPVEEIRAQVSRILSLEHDGTGWDELGRRDPVLGALQRRFPGLRPVLFHSPYEAAAWAVIVARTGRVQAQRVRRVISERYGTTLELAGERLAAFPAAEALLAIDEPIPGITNEKRLRLQGIAHAELEGRLDVEHLRRLGPDAAMAELQQLRGIGPFSSSLIAVRATGFTDVLPVEQPQVLRAVERAYELSAPLTPDAFRELAEPWRPFRTWASVLLRVASTSVPHTSERT